MSEHIAGVTQLEAALAQNGSVLRDCKTCAKQTAHLYEHTPLTRLAVHWSKIAVGVCTMGFIFPNELSEPSCGAHCTVCGNRTNLDYR